MELSNLELSGRLDYLEKLKNQKLEYRKKLNFNDELTFGIEIEYCDAPSNKILKTIKKFKKHPQYNLYGEWNFSIDDDFINFDKGIIYGGEVSTPVFTNRIDTFKEIKQMCLALKKYNATVNEKVGLHYHISKDVFNEDYNILLKFLKLYTVFEHIIYKFGYNGAKEREAIKLYCFPVRYTLIDILDNIECKEFYNIVNSINDIVLAKSRGINFQNVPRGINSKETIEFRMCNSSIDPIVIQNEINLFCNLLLSCAHKEMDQEYLDYRIKELKRTESDLLSYRNLNIEDAFLFADIIFDEEIDKDYFIKQYIKE